MRTLYFARIINNNSIYSFNYTMKMCSNLSCFLFRKIFNNKYQKKLWTAPRFRRSDQYFFGDPPSRGRGFQRGREEDAGSEEEFVAEGNEDGWEGGREKYSTNKYVNISILCTIRIVGIGWQLFCCFINLLINYLTI